MSRVEGLLDRTITGVAQKGDSVVHITITHSFVQSAILGNIVPFGRCVGCLLDLATSMEKRFRKEKK